MAEREDEATRLEIIADGDRAGLEALQLEIRRLAREHGVEIVDVEIMPVSPRRPARRRRG
jgi:hypothetical protein